MSYFKNFFLGLLIATPATHAINKMQEKESSPAKDKIEQTTHPHVSYDKYAKYRQAEEDVLPMLVFYEGCSRKAYQDIVGIWTIGIGNTKHPDGRKITSDDSLENNQAILEYVRAHLEREVYPEMNKYITRKLPSHQMAALLSLCYNCGTTVLGKDAVKSPLAIAVNKGDNAAVAKYFMKKVSTRKQRFVPALAVRRVSEIYCYQGLISPQEMMDFYVGGQRGLTTSQLLKKDRTGNYTIIKSDTETLEKFKQYCRTAPSAEDAEKYAWFGGDKRVGEFASLREEASFTQNLVAFVTNKINNHRGNSGQIR